jgi:antitoxin component of MazEF toxin-antitoxin module
MSHQYKVRRKLQEQSGSYFVILPKIWVDALGLRQGDNMTVTFNGTIKIEPSKAFNSEKEVQGSSS